MINDLKYLIDTSYLIYYTSFSVFKTYVWKYNIQQNDLKEDFDPTLDVKFCNLLQNRLKNNILNPIQLISPFFNKSNIIFCLDCSRKNIWRRDIFPQYKISRETNIQQKKFNISKVFKYCYDIILPEICAEYNCKKIYCEYVQGDDIIAILCNNYIKQNKEQKIVILSADRDLVQLYNQNIQIITIDGKKRTPKQELETLLKKKIDQDISSNDFLLFKILVGDISDDIPNIKNGIGPKKAYQLVKNQQLLKTLLKQDKIIAESFLRNKKLISFKEIPSQLNTLVLEIFKQSELNEENNIIF